ncbi:MAG: patatin-like phospholipase family protein [Chloroflexi bacterium]|nr:patatin-like phospholipase family protein [Chloroflexota bacterium]
MQHPEQQEHGGTNGSRETGQALVLSGGGVLGAFQAGFLRALFRTSFRPSLIVGTSAGALNGAFLALHPDEQGAEELVGIWRELRQQRLFLFNPLRIAYQVASKQLCLSNGEILSELAERHILVDDFSATEVPLYITATNLSQGRKVTFHEGPISRAVLASTALPGIFCPVEIDGDIYVDGGVLANLDLETAIELGATDILAVDLSNCIDGRRPDSIVGVWMQTLNVIHRERVEREMERLDGRARITLVQPGIESGLSLSSLAAVDRLLEEGERFGADVLGSYLAEDGRLQAGTIHMPLHIHQ